MITTSCTASAICWRVPFPTYQATGKDKLLKAASRYADYVAAYFGPEEGKCKGYPGHEIAEMALVRLYETTQESKYLDPCKILYR